MLTHVLLVRYLSEGLSHLYTANESSLAVVEEGFTVLVIVNLNFVEVTPPGSANSLMALLPMLWPDA